MSMSKSILTFVASLLIGGLAVLFTNPTKILKGKKAQQGQASTTEDKDDLFI